MKVEFDKCTLICGDCMREFGNIPDKSIDLVLCDLPYGTTKCDWDDQLPLDDMWKELKRLTSSPS